ncbi:hypothetical protein baBA2_000610 [Borrelia anserina]|nr:hypothetical protein [Borrelia anserina]APR65053.1 hypothetical protein N187_03035 [Borrelia anserina Es]UPA06979.1 hypothetical protein baBA2_000610 [Borrelia anserina]
MLKSQFFVKKCKRCISENEVLINNVKSVENVFYDFLKIFDRKALESAFNYYYENFDFDEGIYSFIDRFIPIIDFLSLEVLDYEFNINEKKLILEIFDSSAYSFEVDKLNEFARAVVSLGILN